MNPEDLTLFIISDYTGQTAKTVIDSTLIQFEIEEVEVKNFSEVDSIEKLDEILKLARQKENLILAYTIVIPELCQYLEEEAEKLNIPTLDILGPFMNQIAKLLDQKPQLEVGLSYDFTDEQSQKTDCLEFALRCDDGGDINRLVESDIILLGVSRTSKTPLSIYLASKNYKVANLSLSPDVLLPKEIYDLNPDKLFGLMIEPEALQKLRKKRLEIMDFSPQANYAELARIKQELRYAQNVMDELGCSIIDITDKAVEEIAFQITAGN